MSKLFQYSPKKRSLGIFFGIIAYYAVTRLLLLYRYGYAGLGYDTGIYRRIVLDYTTKVGEPPFAFGFIAKYVHQLGFSVDAILYGGYMAVAVGILFVLYYYTRRITNTPTALIATTLFATSVTQFGFFWWYYYRNLIALLCILSILYLFEKHSKIILFPTAILVAIHPVSAVPLFLTLGIYTLFHRERMSYVLIYVCGGALLAVLANFKELYNYVTLFFSYSGTVVDAPEVMQSELTGQFISLITYIRHSALYLIFGIVGWLQYRKKYPIQSLYIIVCLSLMAVQFLLYRRLIVYLDVFVIFFASVFIYDWLRSLNQNSRTLVIVVYTGYMIGLSALFAWQKQPLISPQQLEEIIQLEQTIPPQSAILSLSKWSAPWVLGFAGDHDIIAPGTFEFNVWDAQQWQQFWDTTDSEDRYELMSLYRYDVLYIYGGEYDMADLFVGDPRIIQLDDRLWKYTLIP